jgi:ATP-dependent helicase/nuclease subunit A
MLNFTKKQQRAIDTQGNILVSAAAGSGKTRVMTERICNILREKKANIDEILVLTFTDAAAKEMKRRIYLRLFDLSIEEISESLGIIAESVVKADISTIHSFCKKVIDENYFNLGLSPTARISEDIEAQKLLSKSLSELLEKKLEDQDKDTLYLYQTFANRSGKPLNDIIIAIYKELMVLPEPKQYADLVLSQYDKVEYKQKIKDIYLNDVGQKLEAALEILQNTKAIADQCDFSITSDILSVDIDEAKNHIKVFETESYEQYCRLPHLKTQFRIAKDNIDDEVKAVFTKNRDDVKKIFDSTKGSDDLLKFEKYYENEKTIIQKQARILFDIVFELTALYQHKKSLANFLDYSDLEHFAYEILKQVDIKDKYKYIFIDEYQDTNPIQEAILRQVKGKDNLFMVGDVKQSIYGFRHADPQIFKEKQDQYTQMEAPNTDKQNELIRMNQNFRSFEKVVFAINAIMDNIMMPTFGDIDYKNEEALIFGSGHHGGKASLTLIDVDEKLYECEDSAKVLSTKQAEAYKIAHMIEKICGETIYSRDSEGEKPIEYSDIVVLLRETKNSGIIYKRVFESMGIPVDCEIKSDTMIPEIMVFTNLLKFANNPIDDIALLSVMRFESFGFTAEDFVAIKQDRKDLSFYDSVLYYKESKSDVLASKLDGFFETIEQIRLQSKLLSKAEFLDYCLIIGCFEQVLSTGNNAKRDKLINFVSKLADQTPKTATLARIVDFIEDMAQTGQFIKAEPTVKSPNSVKIMTVHKSKGLEFPVVFLGGLDANFIHANKSNMVIDKSYGLGLKILDPSKNYAKNGVIYTAINMHKVRAELLESLRLLYVAMTRAENRLYLCGVKKNIRASVAKWVTAGQKQIPIAKNFLDLIVPVLINQPSFIEGFNIARFLPPTLSRYDHIPVVIKPKVCKQQPSKDDRLKKFDAFIKSKAKKITLGFEYGHAGNLFTPSKKSVSSLSQKAGENKSINEQKEKKVLEMESIHQGILTGAQRGTALHIFMQHADFSKTQISDIEQQKDAFVLNHLLTTDEASSLPVEKIQVMLNSPLFERVRKSSCVYKEKNFTFKTDSASLGLPCGETVLIQGTIDCCFLEDNEFILIDYKTDRKITSEKIEKYTKQMDYYATALRKITHKSVKQRYLYFLLEGPYLV